MDLHYDFGAFAGIASYRQCAAQFCHALLYPLKPEMTLCGAGAVSGIKTRAVIPYRETKRVFPVFPRDPNVPGRAVAHRIYRKFSDDVDYGVCGSVGDQRTSQWKADGKNCVPYARGECLTERRRKVR